MHAVARAFDGAGEAYERGRPSFPADAVAFLADVLALRPASTVVDVAAGTGKLTRLLVPTGARIVAVEPLEGMWRQLVATTPGVRVVPGVAEALPLRDASVDAVTVSQAFHWFRQDEARAEIRRALRPAGRLALVWNTRDESVDWVAELSALLDRYEGDVPRGARHRGTEGFARSALFGPLEHEQFSYEQLLDADLLADRVASISFIAALPSEERDGVLRHVRELVRSFPATFSLPYRTDVYWTERL